MEKTHKNYTCPFCIEQLVPKVIRGIGDYVCPICGQSFTKRYLDGMTMETNKDIEYLEDYV